MGLGGLIMTIKQSASAGTMESCDIYITVEPTVEPEIQIYLKSPVIQQFGDEIRQVIRTTLRQMDINSAIIYAVDKGALNCTIVARVTCAVMRATDEKYTAWGVVDYG